MIEATNRDLLVEVYAAFNRRDFEAVFARMSDDVDWPNAMEGTRVRGKDAVRAYWLHQWSLFDPQVEPVAIENLGGNESSVRVRQVVRTLDGAVISEAVLDHIYRIEDGLIVRMDVRDSGGGNRFRPDEQPGG